MISTLDIFKENGPLAKILGMYRSRPEQAELAQSIGELLERPDTVGLFEAGTGTGKTMAYLIPALQIATPQRKIVISTHTIALQNQLIEKDIPIAQQSLGSDKLVVTAKGRSNYLCILALDGQIHGFGTARSEQLESVRKWSVTTSTGDRSDLPFTFDHWRGIAVSHDTCIGRRCPFYDKCFYFKMKKQMEKASIILVNHALFFADLILKSDPGSDNDVRVLPEYDSVIFDEAHHIPAVATDALTRTVSLAGLYSVLRKVNGNPSAGLNVIQQSGLVQNLGEAFFQKFAGAPEREFLISREEDVSFQEVEDRGMRLVAELSRMNDHLESAAEAAVMPDSDWLKSLARWTRAYRDDLNDVILTVDTNRVLWGERPNTLAATGSVELHRTPVKAGDTLRNVLWNTQSPRSAVLISATLTTEADFSYIISTLGLNQSNRTVVQSSSDSPFHYRSQCLVYTPEHLGPPEDSVTYRHAMVDEVVKLVVASGGGAFVLLTSHKALLDVYVQLLTLEIPFKILKQGDAPAGRLVQRFKENQNAVLLGTFSFWEGIDVQGPSLRLVVIDKLPFAVPDHPVSQAQAEKSYEDGGDYFNEFVVPQAVIRLKQGVGRLIRSETDYGVVAILDSRLRTSRYGEVFIGSLPGAPMTSEMEDVERFYARFKSKDAEEIQID